MVNIKFIVEFFALRYVRTIILLDCSANISDLRSAVHYSSMNFNGTFQIVNISSDMNVKFFSSISNDLGMVIDSSCEQTEEVFKVMSKNTIFNASYEWLIFSKPSLNWTIWTLRKQNLNMDSRVTVVDEEDPGDIILYDVYNTLFKRKGKLHVSIEGRWSPGHGFNNMCRESLYERRINFGNIVMRTIFTDIKRKHNDTIIHRLTTTDPLENYALWRFTYHYVEMLALKHNFRLQYIATSGWGNTNLALNSSVGLLGQLLQQQVDFTLNPIYMYQDRVAYIDYSVIVAMHTCLFVFRHPKRHNDRTTFLQPFENNLWFGLLAGLAVAAVILSIVFRSERTFPWNVSRTSQEYLLTIFGFICQQGYDGITFLDSTKVIIIIMISFASLLYQYYGSFIIASLLTTPPRYLNTIRQLILSDLEVTIENLFYLWEFYNRTRNPEVIELFQKKILTGSERATDVISGIQKIKKGGYAMQCDIGYAYPIIKRTFTDDEICDLQEIEVYPRLPLHLALPKGSPLKQFMRVTLRKLIESGSGPYFEREFFSRKPPCPLDSLEEVAQIEVIQVVHVFYILALAMVVCLIMLVGEQIHYRYQRRRRERFGPYLS